MSHKKCFLLFFIFFLIIFLTCKQRKSYSFKENSSDSQNSKRAEKKLSGEEYLMKKLRLFSEITPLQEEWMALEEGVLGIIPPIQDVNWKKINKKGKLLLEKANKFLAHYGEDRLKINNEINEENKEKLELFLKQSFIYADTLHRTIIKLALIINRLYKMTVDPGSWSAKEYLKELDQYKSLCDEYHKEGNKMNEELEKMRNVTLKIRLI